MKKNLKKVLLCMVGASMIMSSLTACTSKKTGVATEYNEDGETVIHIITASKDVNPKGHEIEMQNYKEFAEFYKQTYADESNAKGKVGVEVQPSYFNFNTKDFAALAIGGQLPTYYWVPLTEAKGIMDAGYAKDITKYMEKYGYTKGIDSQIEANISRDTDGDGKKEMYLVPNGVYAIGIAVNLELLGKAGRSEYV